MQIKDKVTRYGDDINTDLIIAGKYTKTFSIESLAQHCMEDLDREFTTKIKKASILVGGKYFGCGSSREAAPIALKAAGTKAVFAKTFARIFYRNAINVGLPVIECNTDNIHEGDELQYEMGGSEVINLTTGEHIPCAVLPDVMLKIFEYGGLTEFFKETGGY